MHSPLQHWPLQHVAPKALQHWSPHTCPPWQHEPFGRQTPGNGQYVPFEQTSFGLAHVSGATQIEPWGQHVL